MKKNLLSVTPNSFHREGQPCSPPGVTSSPAGLHSRMPVITLDLAFICFSACDCNDFGTPSQPFSLPWLPSRSCKPGSFISYLQELGSHRARRL